MEKLKSIVCVIIAVCLCLGAAACGAGQDVSGLGTLDMGKTNGNGGGVGTLGEPAGTQQPSPTASLAPSTPAPAFTPAPASTPTGGTPSTDGAAVFSSTAQDFSFLYDPAYAAKWDDSSGATVYTQYADSIPYLLVYRNVGNVATFDPAAYYETKTQNMRDEYGARLKKVGDYQTYTVSGKSMPGQAYTYTLDTYVIEMLSLVDITADSVVTYTCKYIQGEETATLAALAMAAGTYQPSASYYSTGSAPTGQTPTALSTQSYECDEFKMTIPAGWDVTYDVVDAGANVKRIYIFVRDPSDANNMIYFVEALEPFFPSENSRSAWASVAPQYANAPILDEPNAETTLLQWANIYTLMKQEGILSRFFANYSMQEVLQSEETSRSSEGMAISHVVARVSIPEADELYDMFFENALQMMDAPTGLPSNAMYYISYSNNGVIVRDSLAESQFDTLHGCLMSLDLTAYANSK